MTDDTRLEQLDAIADDLLTEAEAEVKVGRAISADRMDKLRQIHGAAMDICDLCEAMGVEYDDEEDEGDDDGEMEMEGSGGMMAGKAQRTFGGKERDDLDDSDFAGPGRTYPIMTAQDVKDAARLIGKADDPEAVKRKIIAICKRKGLMDALPDSWKNEMGMMKKDADGLIEMVYGSEIKTLEDGEIFGYAVLFGDAETPDLSEHRDYFSAKTEFWLDKFGWPRPMTYHHGLDPDTRDDPVVGTWTKAGVDDQGVWMRGQLDKAHRYHGAIKELVKRGYLKLSSDSAPQWVLRERQPNGAHFVKRWPLLTSSPTVTPAEPRMSGLAFKSLLAELGLENIQDDSEAHADEQRRQDAVKAAQERVRKLSLELDFIELTETTV